MDQFCKDVIERFPPEIEVVFAYGSGVFQQKNNNLAKDNMVDLIFVVKDPVAWHRVNIERFSKHYSFLRLLGPDFVANIQCNYGSSVYFNTLVEFEGRLIKYGVLSVEAFLDDLNNWSTLYISGRLHKPVLQVKNFDKDPYRQSFKSNLESAVNTSLLLLPERFPEDDLFLTIAGLSYTGDFRMTVGEDRNKIKNIVLPNIDKFKELYKMTIDNTSTMNSGGKIYSQDKSIAATTSLLKSLPLTVKTKLNGFLGYQKENDFLRMYEDLSHSKEKSQDLIQKSVASIVRKSSITQSLKGIFTAGFGKSILYSSAKITKMAKSFLK